MSPPKSGILPNHEDLAGVATDYSYCSHGVLDSGATKTVIGSNLVEPLLQSFHPEVKSRVTRCTCDVTFRFGNLSTLEAKHALVIPVGYLNLRVASVQGNTPFLLSNTLMRALKAVLDSYHQELRSPMFHHPIKLQLSSRGLFLLVVNELVKSTMNSSHVGKCQDTFVSEDVKERPKLDRESVSLISTNEREEMVQGSLNRGLIKDNPKDFSNNRPESADCEDCNQPTSQMPAISFSSKCESDSSKHFVDPQQPRHVFVQDYPVHGSIRTSVGPEMVKCHFPKTSRKFSL